MLGTVLFVDDDVAILDGLKRSLHKAPYQMEFAHSGQEALDLLQVMTADVIVTDQQMPGMPGTELLTMVRESYPHTVRIMLAGQATIGAAVNAVNAGAVFRFLLKPSTAQEVDLAVRQALAQKVLMDRSWSLLRYVRWQTDVLERVKARSPEVYTEACEGVAAITRGPTLTDDLHLAMARELDRVAGSLSG